MPIYDERTSIERQTSIKRSLGGTPILAFQGRLNNICLLICANYGANKAFPPFFAPKAPANTATGF